MAADAIVTQLTNIRESRDNALNALSTIEDMVAQVQAQLVVDPVPKQFVGFIRDYRYRSGGVDEMPKHTMRVVVDSSMILWVSVPSSLFETNIVQAAKMKSMDKLNGRLVECARQANFGIVPVRLLPDPLRTSEGSLISDQFNRVLYMDARVYVPNYGDTGSVTGGVPNGVSVQLDRTESAVNIIGKAAIRL